VSLGCALSSAVSVSHRRCALGLGGGCKARQLGQDSAQSRERIHVLGSGAEKLLLGAATPRNFSVEDRLAMFDDVHRRHKRTSDLPDSKYLLFWRTAAHHLRPSTLLSVFVLLPAILSLLALISITDPSLRLGSLVDPETFQLLPAGDPRLRDSPDALALKLRHERMRGVGNMTRAELYARISAPIDSLLATSPAPHRFDCQAEGGPLVWIGIFSTAQNLARRQIIRALYQPDLPPSSERLIELRFIIGRPPNENWKYLLESENDVYKDIVVLDVEENMEEGKTWEYFRWLSQEKRGPRPQFVLKTDDDVNSLL
jgi:hypothetical protein